MTRTSAFLLCFVDFTPNTSFFSRTNPLNTLYFGAASSIQRYDFHHKALHVVLALEDSSDPRQAIEIDPATGSIYWVDATAHQILRAGLDGRGVETLFETSATTFGPWDQTIDVAHRRLYWTDTGAGIIWASDLDGQSRQEVVRGLDEPSTIAIDEIEEKLYWVDDTHTIRRANLDGAQIETAIDENTFAIADLVIDQFERKLYWTPLVGPRHGIRRANLDGSDPELLTDDQSRNFDKLAIDLAERKLYFTDLLSQNRIGRMNLDGSNSENLVLGQTTPVGGLTVALVPEPSACMMACIGCVVFWAFRLRVRGTSIQLERSSRRISA